MHSTLKSSAGSTITTSIPLHDVGLSQINSLNGPLRKNAAPAQTPLSNVVENGSAAHSILHDPPSTQTMGLSLSPNVAAVHAPGSLQYMPPVISWPSIIWTKHVSASSFAMYKL